MSKRIKIYMPTGDDTVEIWDDNLDKFLAKGYKLSAEKKSTRTYKKKEVKVEDQQTNKEGVNEWQHIQE
jgi:hypothetical protein